MQIVKMNSERKMLYLIVAVIMITYGALTSVSLQVDQNGSMVYFDFISIGVLFYGVWIIFARLLSGKLTLSINHNEFIYCNSFMKRIVLSRSSIKNVYIDNTKKEIVCVDVGFKVYVVNMNMYQMNARDLAKHIKKPPIFKDIQWG